MSDTIVVGAGISGLATAWYLSQRGADVLLLEADGEPGGCLRTLERDGFRVDAGANSTLDKQEGLAALVRELGLEEELLEANPAAKRRYIVKNGELLALPSGPGGFITTPIFSPWAKLRLMLEPVFRRARHEESIAEFVRRRLGREFLDWAIDPFVSGVYAGDPRRLSVRAATAKIYALEKEYGSLILGAVGRLLQRRTSGPMPAGRLVGFRGGMQALPRAIVARLGERVHLGEAVTALRREGELWRVSTGAGEYQARHVVLALPAYACAQLLRPQARAMAEELEAIAYPPVATVALGFERSQVDHPLDGFGALIPRKLGIETLGVLFSSTLFPQRAPEGKVLLTSFLGGAQNPGVAARSEAEMARRVLEDLRPLLGIRGEPVFEAVNLWPRAIPQYELGHLDRLQRIERARAALPGLHFRSNWREGISVGDCINAARRLAEVLA